jgi:hypothetical protein
MKRKTINDFKNEIIKYYKDGKTLKELSIQYNYSISHISIFLRKNNVIMRKSLGTKSILWNYKEEIIKMYENNYSCIDIGKKYNVNHNTINRFLRKNGIKIRKYQTEKEKLKRSTSQKGSKSYNWKGGKSILHQNIRNTFQYRQWRCDIFYRDGFTCQKCFKKGGVLNSHHIKELNKIILEYNIKSIEEALNCEELWNINNGITLCKECHKKTIHNRK